jgi:hypothetical protein
MSPALPEFDLEDWGRRPYLGRVRLMCEAWARQASAVDLIVSRVQAFRSMLTDLLDLQPWGGT